MVSHVFFNKISFFTLWFNLFFPPFGDGVQVVMIPNGFSIWWSQVIVKVLKHYFFGGKQRNMYRSNEFYLEAWSNLTKLQQNIFLLTFVGAFLHLFSRKKRLVWFMSISAWLSSKSIVFLKNGPHSSTCHQICPDHQATLIGK
jgi:hypothetical protein